MKKYFIIIFIFAASILNSAEDDIEMIKRTIAILPFYNQNNLKQYDYLADTLRDALKAELLSTNSFLFADFHKVDKAVAVKAGSIEEGVKEKKAKQIAYKTRSDVVVIGKYIIIDDKILVEVKAIDIFKNKTAAISIIKGDIGLDIFRIIDDVSKDMADKMFKQLKMIEKSYFDEMMKQQKENNIVINKIKLKPYNKAGIICTVFGSVFFLSGIPLIFYDLLGLKPQVDRYTAKNISENDSYEEYLNIYYSYVSLFITGISFLSLGTILLSCGIPMVIYQGKNKDKKVSINLKINTNINFYLAFVF